MPIPTRSPEFQLLPESVQRRYDHVPEIVGNMKIKNILNRWDDEIFDCYITIDDVWYQAIPIGPWECTYDGVEIWHLYPLDRHQEGAAKYCSSPKGKKIYKHIWDQAAALHTPYSDTMKWMQDLFPRPRTMDPYTNQFVESTPFCAIYTHFNKDRYLDDYMWEFEDSELAPWVYNTRTHRGEQYHYMRDGYDDSCLIPYRPGRPAYYVSPFQQETR